MLKLATVFSGIGAIEFALKRMNIDYEVEFACDNGERDVLIDYQKEMQVIKSLQSPKDKMNYVNDLYFRLTKCKNYMEEEYKANYKIKDDLFFQDVCLLDGRDFENKIDLFVGGSPCQSFSSVGFQGGLEDTRGTLFYEFARLVKEIQPKVFIYENVRNLLKHDKGKTWATIKNVFDELGYDYKFEVLNAADYGIPQTRRRLFVVGFRKDLGIEFNFPPKTKKLQRKMKDFTINYCDEGCMSYNKKGEIVLLKKQGEPDEKYTLSPKLYNYVMKTGTKKWSQKVEINLDVARTLLKTMGNRHRAGVDNYVSFDGTEHQGSVRMLTEREALRLMGFTDDFKIVVSRAQVYKQAGNSIVVDVLIEILKLIFETDVFN